MTAPAAASPVAADPAELLDVVETLTDLLERETKLVRALHIKEIAPLQPDKLRLVQMLRKALKQFEGGATLPPAAKRKWQAMGQKLVQAATDNERALRIGRTATERLIAAVVGAVKETRRPQATYAPRKRAAREASIAGVALDRRL
jgi:hypothetical protein